MTLGIPRLEIEHDEVDRLELGVRQPIAVVAVGIERRVNAHRLCCREQLCGEAILHQWLTATQSEAPGHGFQAVAIFPQLGSRVCEGNGDAVAHRPRVAIVTIGATPHAAARPGNNTNAGSVYGGACGEGVEKSHVARGKCRPHFGVWNVLAEIDAKLEWTARVEG